MLLQLLQPGTRKVNPTASIGGHQSQRTQIKERFCPQQLTQRVITQTEI
jgi:hypothetical protein